MHLGSPITTYRLVTYIHVLIYLTKKRRSFMVLGKTLSLSLSLSPLMFFTYSAIGASTANPGVSHGGTNFLFGISSLQIQGHNLI